MLLKKNKWIVISFTLLLLTIIIGFFVINLKTSSDESKNVSKIKLVKEVDIVNFGDSLTKGVGDSTDQQGYTKRISKLVEKQIKVPTKNVNFGKSGDTSQQITKRLKDNKKQQSKLKTADVIIMTVGGNDLIQILQNKVINQSEKQVQTKVKNSVTNYQNNLNELLLTIRKYNKTAPIFLFGNYNPLYVYFPKFESLNDSVKIYNQVNKQMVEKFNGYYVSIFNGLTYGQYQNNAAKKTLLTSHSNVDSTNFINSLSDTKENKTEKNDFLSPLDHFHPNAKGYDFMTKVLLQKMLLHDDWQYKSK